MRAMKDRVETDQKVRYWRVVEGASQWSPSSGHVL